MPEPKEPAGSGSDHPNFGQDQVFAESAGTQDSPIEHGNRSDVDEQVEGIVAQSRADVALNGEQDLATLVERRLKDAGIETTADEVARLVERVGNDEDGGRTAPGVHPDAPTSKRFLPEGD